MPFRVTIPEGTSVPAKRMMGLGTEQLVAIRKQYLDVIYDAPETTLTPREREATRIIFAVRGGCSICSGLRLAAAKEGFSSEEIPEDLYQAAIEVDLDWPGFSKRERLLVEIADRFERDVDSINGDDGLWRRINELLTETELADTLNMFGIWVGAGRTLKVLGVATGVCDLDARGDVSYRNAWELAPHS